MALALMALAAIFLLAIFMVIIAEYYTPVRKFLIHHLLLPAIIPLAYLRGMLCQKCAHRCTCPWCSTPTHFMPQYDCPECQHWVNTHSGRRPSNKEEGVEFAMGYKLEKAALHFLATGDLSELHRMGDRTAKLLGRPIRLKVKADKDCPDSGRSLILETCPENPLQSPPSAPPEISTPTDPKPVTSPAPKSESPAGENTPATADEDCQGCENCDCKKD